MGMGLTQLILRVNNPLSIGLCQLIYFILLLFRVPDCLAAIAAILYRAGDVMVPLVVLPYEISTYNEKGNDYQQGNPTSNKITAGIQQYFLF